ncbi:hypothetical protein MTR67_043619 [Solanum verrucosum]|uniref:Uncharacterized protein n=1 Tax=Solanum verrucosum TaxID=315347 RepID=A0AAF0US07_SOLVR|nr:hypothetical protein MTR67_043619 [Solanum verrucosum]
MAPTKIKCFTRLVVRRACLTHEVLQKKGRVVVTRFFCAMKPERQTTIFFCIASSPHNCGICSSVLQRRNGQCMNIL